MKRFSTILVLLFFLLKAVAPSMLVFAEDAPATTDASPEAQSDSLRQLGKESLLDAGDEIFEGLQSVGTASCDVISAFNEVESRFSLEWSIGETIGELLALIKNRAWRELIWAVNDERQRMSDELIKLKKRKCLIDAAILGAGAKGFVLGKILNEQDPSGEKDMMDNFERLEQNLAMRIAELEGKLVYFEMQRGNLFFGKPSFGAFAYNDETEEGKRDIVIIDTIFYFILDPTALFGDFKDQIATGTVEFLKRTVLDGVSFFKNIPDTCFMLGQILDQTILHFAMFGNKVSNLASDKPIDLREYIEKHSPFLGNPDIDSLCKKGTTVTEKEIFGEKEKKEVKKEDLETAEGRYQAFINRIQGILQDAEAPLVNAQEVIDQYRLKIANAKTEDEKKQLRDKVKGWYDLRGWQLAVIDYYSLVLSVAPPPGSDSLSKLAAGLTRIIEAIMNLMEEDEKKKKKKKPGQAETAEEKKKRQEEEKKEEEERNVSVRVKKNLSERSQKIREKKLQDICSRLEAMYQKSGRDTTDLPIIGYVNETTYCQASPPCEELLQQDTPGLSSSARKFEDCLIEKEVNKAKKADKERKAVEEAIKIVKEKLQKNEEKAQQAKRKAACEEELKKETINPSDYEGRLKKCMEKKEEEEKQAAEAKRQMEKEQAEAQEAKRKAQLKELQDIGALLEQGAYQSLLAARDEHMKKTREQYVKLYEVEAAAMTVLTEPLKDIANGYFDPENQENYTAPKKDDAGAASKKKNPAPIHYNVLGKVYDDLYHFMSKQEDFSCSAPEKLPEE